jgi:hypothetical protein
VRHKMTAGNPGLPKLPSAVTSIVDHPLGSLSLGTSPSLKVGDQVSLVSIKHPVEDPVEHD